ncbi:Ribosomal silencing factor RsfS [Vibrio stylophorae]|uniref:Ribosomal silencing factor RsfS n=1 Tax=Vibrio stylophorae TaxID=659351 RepID=A0ABN8DT78_9VIBR|nr:ribosome silencing factor [Vibrio stylophorae]CAH0534035.1 Ribosomal silencing factor RsfS [Vibrio stylophorae]
MQIEHLEQFAVEAVDDMKAEAIVTLNVEAFSSITSRMVICTGTSNRHVHAIAHHVVENAKALKLSVFGTEGEKEGEWVVVDLGDVMVHVMQQESRERYQLEKLWS